MDAIQNNPGNYIAVGENIHTTRVLLRKGKRIAEADGQEVIFYEAADGASRRLPIPDSVKSTQDYDEGRVKHVKIALAAAMGGVAEEAASGLAYLRALALHQEQAGATYLDINVDEFSLKLSEQKSMTCRNFNTIQPSLGHSQCSIGMGFDYLPDIIRGHGPGHSVKPVIRDC